MVAYFCLFISVVRVGNSFASSAFFEIFAVVCGAALYHFTVSIRLKRLFCGIFDIFLKIIKIIFKILLTPAVFLDKILIEPIKQRLIRKRK